MHQMLAEVEGWAAQFERLVERISPRFARPEVRRRVAGFLRGLLGEVERKNGWQVAERLADGEVTAEELVAAGRARQGDHPRWDAAAADQRPLGRRWATR